MKKLLKTLLILTLLSATFMCPFLSSTKVLAAGSVILSFPGPFVQGTAFISISGSGWPVPSGMAMTFDPTIEIYLGKLTLMLPSPNWVVESSPRVIISPTLAGNFATNFPISDLGPGRYKLFAWQPSLPSSESGSNEFEIIAQYSLTIETLGSGITTGTGTYNSGMLVTITAIPDSGWEFAKWTGDVSTLASTVSATTIIIMKDSYNITAIFRQITTILPCTLTINASGGGQTSGGGSYPSGTLVTINAIPDSGWEFVKWTGDVRTLASTTSATTTIMMKDIYNITAIFRQTNQLPITYKTPIYWPWITLISIPFIFVSGYFAAKYIKKFRTDRERSKSSQKISLRSRPDPGKQWIASNTTKRIHFEIHLKAIKDTGKQSISKKKALIAGERRGIKT